MAGPTFSPVLPPPPRKWAKETGPTHWRRDEEGRRGPEGAKRKGGRRGQGAAALAVREEGREIFISRQEDAGTKKLKGAGSAILPLPHALFSQIGKAEEREREFDQPFSLLPLLRS